ncbi:hypothetical protein JJB07_10760 [Tumebacillus sp. ITR2]|uniref:DUF4190 domain-containing protein n=1 Tax=Tumebacillus amylolyticus TaxID=2801339 RepID=A0ABS1JA31_9BACL|nr:hypothetical protein [Tumebacillus amylolyticus]MBL0387132.1 hypothetical protein [Tumebacillus amylolyticus]
MNDMYDFPDAPQPQKSGGGLAIAGMIVGIVGLIFCWIPFFGFIVNLTGLILSAFGMKSNERGMAVAGLVMTIIGLLVALLVTVLMIFAIAVDSSNHHSYSY